MKTRIAAFVSVVIGGMLIFNPLKASAATYEDFTYTVSNNAVTISKYNGSDAEVNIPSEIDDKPVVEISYSAFANKTDLESVTIPDTITKIGLNAFEKTGLESITIPQSVSEICEKAFFNCPKLKTINLPDNGMTIGENAFSSTLYADTDANKTDGILYIGSYLISGNGISGKATIKSGTKYIVQGAFKSCSALEEVTIPDGVICIEKSAFSQCKKLTTVVFEGSTEKLSQEAFFGCSLLTDITFPEGLKIIEKNAFNYDYALVDITLPDSLEVIESGAFYGCGYYEDISKWNDGLLYIGKNLVSSKDNVTGDITIKSGTRVIADGVFNNRSNVTGVTFPESLAVIGNNAFNGCKGIITLLHEGKEADWENVNIGTGNEILSSVKVWCIDTYIVEYDENSHWKENYKGDVSDKNNHTFDKVEVKKKATCTESGEQECTCSVCGYSKTEKILPLGHKYEDWVCEKEASPSEEGIEKRTCANDPTHTETRAIAKTVISDTTDTQTPDTQTASDSKTPKTTETPSDSQANKPAETTPSDSITTTGQEDEITIPSKVKITYAKNTKAKTINLIWKNVKGAKGYEVQSSFDKIFKKNKKTTTSTKINCKLSKLKKSKTYYVRVRAFNIDLDGDRVYGKWSAVKKVKIKK